MPASALEAIRTLGQGVAAWDTRLALVGGTATTQPPAIGLGEIALELRHFALTTNRPPIWSCPTPQYSRQRTWYTPGFLNV